MQFLPLFPHILDQMKKFLKRHFWKQLSAYRTEPDQDLKPGRYSSKLANLGLLLHLKGTFYSRFLIDWSMTHIGPRKRGHRGHHDSRAPSTIG